MAKRNDLTLQKKKKKKKKGKREGEKDQERPTVGISSP
jgi:hypothetical protein